MANFDIIELEKRGEFQKIATILFMQCEILPTEVTTSKMKYWEFVSKTKHLLNDDFHKSFNIGDMQPNPHIIDAYKKIGGGKGVAFWREDKFPEVGAMMRLMFTPTVYIYAKEFCELTEQKIGNQPLYLSGLTPMQVINMDNEKPQPHAGCFGVLLLILGITSIFKFLF